MNLLKLKYGFKSFQFRDPVWGLNKDFIEDFCLKLLNTVLNFNGVLKLG